MITSWKPSACSQRSLRLADESPRVLPLISHLLCATRVLASASSQLDPKPTAVLERTCCNGHSTVGWERSAWRHGWHVAVRGSGCVLSGPRTGRGTFRGTLGAAGVRGGLSAPGPTRRSAELAPVCSHAPLWGRLSSERPRPQAGKRLLPPTPSRPRRPLPWPCHAVVTLCCGPVSVTLAWHSASSYSAVSPIIMTAMLMGPAPASRSPEISYPRGPCICTA